MYLEEEYLSLAGHEIIAKAFDGEQAVEIFRELTDLPDVIIMDHRMPLKDGLTACKEILNINPDILIIFVSADFAIKDTAIENGAHAFFSKPIDYEILVEEINNLFIPTALTPTPKIIPEHLLNEAKYK